MAEPAATTPPELLALRDQIDAVDRELRDVARHDAVDQPGGVGSGDLVLVQGSDVDQRGLEPARQGRDARAAAERCLNFLRDSDPAQLMTYLAERSEIQKQSDDRAQLEDNFFLRTRFTEAAGTRSSSAPGLYYRFCFGKDVEFVCIDTSKEHFFRRGRIYEYPKHWDFLEKAFPAVDEAPVANLSWPVPEGNWAAPMARS